ncbi:D-alanyl-D-alanine carboxypeptidase [Actinocorallia longicatena]|uniref:Peptidase S11 D-alanyl-D-alanine carboxypeptidase A N-terminal domain-containing protein n=1 Tax=Actinocorallia longicatena TaxID=111803 RepID=A0ABP6QI03_9ACTN
MGAPLRAAALLTASALTLATCPVEAGAAPKAAGPKFKGKGSYIVVDGDTGQVLAGRNERVKYLPASTQKVLTALTLIPLLHPDDKIKATAKSCYPEGTKVGMDPKLSYKASDLFKAMLMMSANDAAMTLTLPNGYKQTIALMNAKAKEIGATDTVAGSPNGLDVDLGLNLKTQHTTSFDLAIQMRAALKLPEFVQYAQTVNAKFPALSVPKKDKKTGKKTKPKIYQMPIYSHIRLLPTESQEYKGFIAGKNGYTNAAQQTFVGAAKRNGHTIIVALMKAETLWSNASALFDWGFANDGKVTPIGNLPDESAPGKAAMSAALPPAVPAGKTSGGGTDRSDDYLLGGIGLAFILAGVGVLLFRRKRPTSSS